VPGFIVCLLLALLVSIFDPHKNSEVEAEFESYKKISD
jgi:hypothetical protein